MKNKRFTFLCNDEEREDIKNLAQFFNRSQSDTIRELIRQEKLKLSIRQNHLQNNLAKEEKGDR